MKTLKILIMILASLPMIAAAQFSAKLNNTGTTLTITMSDDHLIPPFEAGELWSVLKGTDSIKTVREKELAINCNAFTNQTDDIIGNCTIQMPFSQFKRIGKYIVYKGEGSTAARLNRYFVDSAYFSVQDNQVYLSAYNTRRLFYFGINEDLIR